jgi:CubicO group peptidase (beta-lactamase class C family)
MKLVNKKFYLTGALLLAGLSNGIFAQTLAPDLAELEKTIEAELASSKTPGAAVVIISGDKVLFAKGFGKTSAGEGQQFKLPSALADGLRAL